MCQLALALAVTLCASGAQAQLGRAGAHSKYATEVEPHLVVQWADGPHRCRSDDGIGLGGRVSFPVVDNGPIPTINNTLALGVGLDLSFFDGNCFTNDDFDATSIWVPLDVQWNLFFSDSFSGFIELGFALEHTSQDCGSVGCDDDYNDLELVLWFGGRYHISREIALTLRMGRPSFLFGASFFM